MIPPTHPPHLLVFYIFLLVFCPLGEELRAQMLGDFAWGHTTSRVERWDWTPALLCLGIVSVAPTERPEEADGRGAVCTATQTTLLVTNILYCARGSCKVAVARTDLSEAPLGSGDYFFSPALRKGHSWGHRQTSCPSLSRPLAAGPDGAQQGRSGCRDLAVGSSWSGSPPCCPVTAACLGILLIDSQLHCLRQ